MPNKELKMLRIRSDFQDVQDSKILKPYDALVSIQTTYDVTMTRKKAQKKTSWKVVSYIEKDKTFFLTL